MYKNYIERMGKEKKGKVKKKKKNPTFGGPIIVPVHDCI